MIMSKIYLPTLLIVTKASFADVDVVKFIITFGEKYGQTVTSNLTLKKKRETNTNPDPIVKKGGLRFDSAGHCDGGVYQSLACVKLH